MQYTRNTTMTKTDRDTLRSLHGRKKWEHIWAYYKLPIAIVLIVVYILGYAAYRHVTKKEDVLYLGLVNITAGSDLTEQLTTGFAEAQGLTKKQQVDLLSGLLLSESAEEQYVYASEMKLLGAVSAQRLDVVLMDDNILKISSIMRIAGKTLQIVHQNIVFALGVKVLVLILGALGMANMWEAVFADVGVSVIAILNSMRTLKVK